MSNFITNADSASYIINSVAASEKSYPSIPTQTFRPLFSIPSPQSYPAYLPWNCFPQIFPMNSTDPTKFLPIFQLLQKMKNEWTPGINQISPSSIHNQAHSNSQASQNSSPNYSSSCSFPQAANVPFNSQQLATMFAALATGQTSLLPSVINTSQNVSAEHSQISLDPVLLATMFQIFNSNPTLLTGIMSASNNSIQTNYIQSQTQSQNNNNNQQNITQYQSQNSLDRKSPSIKENPGNQSMNNEGALDLSRSPQATRITPPNSHLEIKNSSAIDFCKTPDINSFQNNLNFSMRAPDSLVNKFGTFDSKAGPCSQTDQKFQFQSHSQTPLKSHPLKEKEFPQEIKDAKPAINCNFWSLNELQSEGQDEGGLTLDEKRICEELKAEALSSKRSNKNKHTGILINHLIIFIYKKLRKMEKLKINLKLILI